MLEVVVSGRLDHADDDVYMKNSTALSVRLMLANRSVSIGSAESSSFSDA
jgi:hypothetical protein